MANKKDALAKQDRVRLWQERLAKAQTVHEALEQRMDEREVLYRGQRTDTAPLTDNDRRADGKNRRTRHVQNIIAENIESEVNSSIPQPKVTARRPQDEEKAKLIENMLRNELNRMPFETMNDLMERMVPIQGGGYWLVEWDNTARSHNTTGEVVVRTLHPKWLVPQDGVFTGVQDMDYLILKLPQTKEYIKRRYGVDVSDESESEPELKRADGGEPSDEMVTQYVAYYRTENGKIGLYSWVCDTELEHLPDYQARHLRRCDLCGEAEPMVAEGEKAVCPRCGGTTFSARAEDWEEIYTERTLSDGMVIPGAKQELGENGQEVTMPTRIPCYKPDCYPVVLQKNISVFGQLLGESDVDKIEYQQNTLNRLNQKILDRLIKAGTKVTLPNNAALRMDSEDSDEWYIDNPSDKACIDVFQFSGDLQYEMVFRSSIYNEARDILGITNSFQGRQDSTAASGKAKEFSAAQAAGRLESKRVMKDAAFADLFRLIFQFKLAYADEPRPVVYQNEQGERQYAEFDRWDFLEQDADGTYWWNDQFLFECDTAAPLANNREAMWSNTIQQMQAGCYGAPGELDTLILFWTKMSLLHYPGAGETLSYFQEQKKAAQEAAEAQARAQAAAQAEAQARGQTQMTEVDLAAQRDAAARVMQMAAERGRADAERDAIGGR